jgi:DNA invertase Pin-like site-specific DNA recombinase
MKRAAIYARVSTREGKQNLDNQLHKLREFAARMAWSITNEYTDQQTGASRVRPGLEALLRDAAFRRFDLVLVFDLSRLTREGPAEAFFLIARLARSKVDFWSMTEEHFRTGDSTGEIFIAIAAHIAKAERTLMKNRIRAGLDRARKNGTVLGHPAVIVDRARVMYLHGQGKTIREIAAALNVSRATIHRRLKELMP